MCFVMLMTMLFAVRATVPGMTYPDLRLSLMSQDPDPADPGGYVDLRWKVVNNGTQALPDAVFQLVPKYPFSLDPNEVAVKDSAGIWGLQRGANGLVLHYKVKVDKDAVEGMNEIGLNYNTCEPKECWINETYFVDVENPQSEFDMVVQDMSGQEVSVAIANTGKNPANSVIVKFPDQDNFRTAGTSGQMVGNLAAGDYTLVSFTLQQKQRITGVTNLTFQIDYTDNIGKRRSLIKNVPFDIGSFSGGNFTGFASNGNFTGTFNGARGRQQTQLSIYQQWWFWAIVIAVAYSLYFGYKTYKKRKDHKEEAKHKGKDN